MAGREGRPAAPYAASSRISAIRSPLPSNPMPGSSGSVDVAVLDLHAVGKSAVGLEQVGIGLVAAQAQAGGDGQRHLVAAVRHAARRRPAVVPSACPACAGTRPGRSSGRSRTAASRGPCACRRSGSGCARPASRTGSRRWPSAWRSGSPVRPAARSRAGRRPPRTRTGRTATAPWRSRWRSAGRSGRWRRRASCCPGPSMLQHGLDAPAVLGQRRAADLHLHHRVAAIEVALHLAPRASRQSLPG